MGTKHPISHSIHFIDLTGKTFRRWTVLKYIGRTPNGRSQWLCRCKCGQRRILVSGSLLSGPTKSCGCWRKQATITRNWKHGNATRKKSPTSSSKKTQIYYAWLNMRQRCTNPRHPDFRLYGGRGIVVAPEWNSFIQFKKDMGEPPSAKHSLDRENNNGPYAPGNVRWSLKIVQANNTRKNVFVTYQGEIHTIAQWLRLLKITRKRLYRYIKEGEAIITHC